MSPPNFQALTINYYSPYAFCLCFMLAANSSAPPCLPCELLPMSRPVGGTQGVAMKGTEGTTGTAGARPHWRCLPALAVLARNGGRDRTSWYVTRPFTICVHLRFYSPFLCFLCIFVANLFYLRICGFILSFSWRLGGSTPSVSIRVLSAYVTPLKGWF